MLNRISPRGRGAESTKSIFRFLSAMSGTRFLISCRTTRRVFLVSYKATWQSFLVYPREINESPQIYSKAYLWRTSSRSSVAKIFHEALLNQWMAKLTGHIEIGLAACLPSGDLYRSITSDKRPQRASSVNNFWPFSWRLKVMLTLTPPMMQCVYISQ